MHWKSAQSHYRSRQEKSTNLSQPIHTQNSLAKNNISNRQFVEIIRTIKKRHGWIYTNKCYLFATILIIYRSNLNIFAIDWRIN